MRWYASLVIRPRAALSCLLAGLFSFTAAGQQSTDVLTVEPPPLVSLKRGETAVVRVQVRVRDGYHVNSNTPSDDYLIPLRLTWEGKQLQVVKITYPNPKMEKFSFSPQPVSVFDGAFVIETVFQAQPGAQAGPGSISGRLRYQACNNRMCLPPKTVPVQAPVILR